MTTHQTDNPEDTTWILWDSECGFCRRSVDWLLDKVNDPDAFTAIPYQKAPRPPITDEIYEACVDAVHVVTPEGRVLRGGEACTYLLDRSSWAGAAAALKAPPLKWLLEPGYKTVANNRGLLSKVMFRARRDKPTKHDVGT